MQLVPSAYLASCVDLAFKEFARNSSPKEALALFADIQMCGIKPLIASFTRAIKLCNQGVLPERALELIHQLQQQGLHPNCHHYTIVVNTFLKTGKIDEAWSAWEEMRIQGVKPDKMSYDLGIIVCLRSKKRTRHMLDLFREMRQEGHTPSFANCDIVMRACSKQGLYQEAVEIFEDMRTVGITPTLDTLSMALRAYRFTRQPEQAVKTLREMQECEFGEDYPGRGHYGDALTACARDGSPALAAGLLWEMRAAGHAPDEANYSSVLQAFKGCERSVEVFRLLDAIHDCGLRLGRTSRQVGLRACQLHENCATASRLAWLLRVAPVWSRQLQPHISC